MYEKVKFNEREVRNGEGHGREMLVQSVMVAWVGDVSMYESSGSKVAVR